MSDECKEARSVRRGSNVVGAISVVLLCSHFFLSSVHDASSVAPLQEGGVLHESSEGNRHKNEGLGAYKFLVGAFLAAGLSVAAKQLAKKIDNMPDGSSNNFMA